MPRKEFIVVLVLATLAAVAAAVRLLMEPPAAARARTDPLRGITPAQAGKDAKKSRAPVPLWPGLARNLRPKDPAAQRILDAAETLAAEGVFEAAIPAYRRFIESFPTGYPAEFALLRVGQCYTLTRRYRDAARHYQSFIERHPGSGLYPLALLWSADSLIHIGDTQKARGRLEEILARHPMSRFAEGAKDLLNALDAAPPPPKTKAP